MGNKNLICGHVEEQRERWGGGGGGVNFGGGSKAGQDGELELGRKNLGLHVFMF